MGKIKILLISDLHLGIEREIPLISADERKGTFGKIMSLAQKHDILLIAGDLVHGPEIDRSYYTLIRKEFSEAMNSGTEIYYTPGPGELDKTGNVNSEISAFPVTALFSDDSETSPAISSFDNIRIYGKQFNSKSDNTAVTRRESGGFHIGLFHADFSPQNGGGSDGNCIATDDIRKMNLDFYALGKNHNFKLFRLSNRILGAYPGSSESCSIDESGDRFAVSMTVEEGSLHNIKRIAVNTGKIISDEIDCSTLINQSSLFEKIRSNYPEKSILNITLTGERDFRLESSFRDELSVHFRGMKITDNSYPTLKIMIEENRGGTSLKNLFFQTLEDELNSVTWKMKNEILSEIISMNSVREKREGEIICSF